MAARSITGFFILLCVFASVSYSQTTGFSYQGNLSAGGSPANGNHDFEFLLFESLAGGAQLGPTFAASNVSVINGNFSVLLDFGNQFTGAARFLEIRVRPSGGGAFTLLSPRQQIRSEPYSIRSLSADTAANATNAATATNALSLGGVASSQYVLTTDARMTDARDPLPGSANYIRNSAVQQVGDFSIAGTGRVSGVFTAPTINFTTINDNFGQRFLSQASGANNLFLGLGTGASNSSGLHLTFVGQGAGVGNVSGSENSYFGSGAGIQIQTGDDNTFVGAKAGFGQTSGTSNSYFGALAGENRSGGSFNVFIGMNAGSLFNLGDRNTFVGQDADIDRSNAVGHFNSLFGNGAKIIAGISNSTAIGARSAVSQANSLVLGSIAGINGATADTKVGIGTTAPSEKLDIAINGGNILFGDAGCPAGSVAIGVSGPFGNCANYSLRGDGTNVFVNRPTGGELLFREGNGTAQLRIRAGGIVAVSVLGSAGSTALCRNASNDISTCSSSMRYKENVTEFTSGMDLIKKLRPVVFNWIDGGALDMGLVAEEVNVIEPLLTTSNEKGQVEGVKYDRVGVALVNAVREQQMQIELQERKIADQQTAIDDLRKEIADLKTAMRSRRRK